MENERSVTLERLSEKVEQAKRKEELSTTAAGETASSDISESSSVDIRELLAQQRQVLKWKQTDAGSLAGVQGATLPAAIQEAACTI